MIDADALLYDLEIVPLTYDGGVDANDLDDIIKRQPTIEPERKTGEWMPHRETIREYIGTVLINAEYWPCDTCGYRVENGQPTYNFYSNCGIYMKGGKNERTKTVSVSSTRRENRIIDGRR